MLNKEKLKKDIKNAKLKKEELLKTIVPLAKHIYSSLDLDAEHKEAILFHQLRMINLKNDELLEFNIIIETLEELLEECDE